MGKRTSPHLEVRSAEAHLFEKRADECQTSLVDFSDSPGDRGLLDCPTAYRQVVASQPFLDNDLDQLAEPIRGLPGFRAQTLDDALGSRR